MRNTRRVGEEANGRKAEVRTSGTETYGGDGLVRYHPLSPHSNAYYHVSATYWPSGLVNTLNTNLCTVPVWKYTPDGEGRVYSVGASSGQAPVSAILYNNFSQPLSITYGSADSDNLSYDPNTGRMIQFLAAINGSTTQTGRPELERQRHACPVGDQRCVQLRQHTNLRLHPRRRYPARQSRLRQGRKPAETDSIPVYQIS